MKRLALLIPLALHLGSMLLATIGGNDTLYGWQVWWMVYAAVPEMLGDFDPGFMLGALANTFYLLAFPTLLFSRGEGRPGSAATVVALFSFVAAIPIAFLFPKLLSLPGYWVWTSSFLALAVVSGRGRGVGWFLAPLVARRADSLATELGRAASLAPIPAFVLCAILCPHAEDLVGSLQVIPPDLAVAGSLSVFCLVAGLCWRSSRPRPVTIVGAVPAPL